MRRYTGRIIGTAVGSLAGPAGVLFGLLAGWLVDQFRSVVAPDRALRRFLRNPRRKKTDSRARLYTMCALAAVVLADDDISAVSAPRTDAIALLSAGYATLSRNGTGQGAFDGRFAAATLRRCASMRRIIDVDAITTVVGTTRAHDLLGILARIAVGDRGAMSRASREAFFAIARGLAVDELTARRIAEHIDRLDERSCRILGVDTCANEADVRGAFRALVRQLHPDGASALEEAQRKSLEEALVRVRDAHDLLIEQLRRRAHPSIRKA